MKKSVLSLRLDKSLLDEIEAARASIKDSEFPPRSPQSEQPEKAPSRYIPERRTWDPGEANGRGSIEHPSRVRIRRSWTRGSRPSEGVQRQ